MGLEKDENPFLGYRAIRLCLDRKEDIYKPQLRALLRASAYGNIRIMIPLVTCIDELREAKALIEEIKAELDEKNIAYKKDIQVGIMVETAAASLIADIFAKEADFFSIGTNDLTQMTLGFSRDDIAKFLPIYLEKGILKNDPFQILDRNGVGQLIREAVFKGRGTRENLKCGICGEHGGEPSSVEFCHFAGLNYVSCSPFRVPIARLAAAHAALKEA